jgi:hypothetical protein
MALAVSKLVAGDIMTRESRGNVAFRTLRFAAGVMVVAGLVVALCWPSERSVWAQLPAPNPLLAPVPPPSAPPTLAAPVTVEAAPVLVPVATPATPSPTPSVQSFNCSCFGPGNGTAWMGIVTSTSYFNAEQTAEGSCVAYNDRSPAPPVIPSAATAAESSIPSLPGNAEPANAAGSLGQSPSSLSIGSQTATIACERCACS